MPSIGDTTRPEYIYDQATDTWIPVGIGPHAHTPAAIGAIASSVVTTKGDIIAATGSGVVVRQGVGVDGSYLMADSSQADGLIYAGPSNIAGKNYLINGNYDIWQRGTSFANPASYFADRWTTGGPSAGVNNMTISRETTGVPAGSQYLLRLTSTGSSSYSSVNQFMETANVVPLQGKTVTYSFKVRRNATYSNSGVLVIVNASSAIDAGSGGTYSTNLAYVNIPLASIPTTAATSTATYYNASVTFNVPNDGTANSLYIQLAYNGAVASGSILEYSQMQIEIGSVATSFARNASTIQGELAACQRYYWRTTANGSNAFLPVSIGISTSATIAFLYVKLPISMRIYPSIVAQSGLCISDLVNYNLSLTNIAWTQSSPDMIQVEATHATGATQYRTAFLRANNSSSAYLEVSAEL
jgi:hypothetical protein